MPQTLVPPDFIRNGRFSLRGPDAHHLVRVLRVRDGSEIDIFDGQGVRYKAVVTRVEPEEPSVEGRVLQEIEGVAPALRLRLFQGIPKGSKFDFVLEKATELGADDIYPFLSEKSVVRIDADAAHHKAGRWERIVEASAKQCNRAAIPVVHAPQPLMDLEKELRDGLTLILSLTEARSLRERIEDIRSPKNANINIVVGPESGLSENEMRWLTAKGGKATSLGSLTLRTETAGLAALAILRYELDNTTF